MSAEPTLANPVINNQSLRRIELDVGGEVAFAHKPGSADGPGGCLPPMMDRSSPRPRPAAMFVAAARLSGPARE